MTSRERLLAILEGKAADRAAVVCPGGMMSMAVQEVMDSSGFRWPRAHSDAETMKGLALAMQEATGFDNLSAPFCMTVEAEAYGATVDLGDETTHPRVRGFIFPTREIGQLPRPDFTRGRAGTLIRVIGELRRVRPDVAVIGNVVGPMSLLGSVWNPLEMLKAARRDPAKVAERLHEITEDLTRFASMQVEAGADAICIADPTATGEILGGEIFARLVTPRLERMIGGIREAGGKTIVHICGDARTILTELKKLSAEAVSFDSMVDIVKVKSSGAKWEAMGNVDAFLLEKGPTRAITGKCEELIEGGVRLLAPACGVVTTTPVGNLRLMADAADKNRNK